MTGLSTRANLKRVTLTAEEIAAHLARARQCLDRSPFGDEPVAIDTLALSDRTQTYRVTGRDRTAVLKMLSPRMAALSARVHGFLASRGVAVPAVLWSDVRDGALLQEDVGRSVVPADPDLPELLAIVRYLARLHDACTLDETTARAAFPDLAENGFPTPGHLAASIVTRYGNDGSRLADVLDLAGTLAATAPRRPLLAISDIKREHFVFRHGTPVLVDLEMASFWDVPAANLATLLAFPGQFKAPIAAESRRLLLTEYLAARAAADYDLDRLSRAVGAAETLLASTLSSTAPASRVAAPMIRDRHFRAPADGASSLEGELGAAFEPLLDALRDGGSRRVLDVGCGSGVAQREIAASFPLHTVFGVDLNPDAPAMRTAVANVRALPFPDGLFDAAIAVQLLQYVPDKLRAIEEICRVLRPGGIAAFAMTEHFGRRSGFLPPLPELVAALPAGTLCVLTTARVRSHDVVQFVLRRHARAPRFPFGLRAAVARDVTGPTPHYLQSRYRRELLHSRDHAIDPSPKLRAPKRAGLAVRPVR